MSIEKKDFTLNNIDNKTFSKYIYDCINNVYLAELEDVTPVDTGLTKASWHLTSEKNFKYSLINTNGEIIIYLEKGTKPHLITPKYAKALRFEVGRKKRLIMKGPLKNATIIYSKAVKHPGTEGRFFIKKTLESSKLKKDFLRQLENKIKK